MNKGTWEDDSEDEDDSVTGNGNGIPIVPDDMEPMELMDLDVDSNPEEEDLQPSDVSAGDISDGQAEDMLSDLHNLLYFHGPLQGGEASDSDAPGDAGHQDDPSPETLNQGSTSGSVHNTEGRDSAQPDEEAGAVGGEVGVVDSLPEEYRYLRNLNYNQPRQPKRGDIVKYFDFNFEGWLRV